MPRGGARAHATKARGRTARAGRHSFGEYAFLEDSRYTSQRENVRARSRHWARPSSPRQPTGCGAAVFLAGNNRQYFSCKAVIGFAGRASVAVQKSASFLQQYEMRTSE